MDPELKITDEEKEGISELRKRFENDLEPKHFDDDLLFLRFLRARNGDLEKSENMLRKHLQWRKKNNIDNVDNFQTPEAWKYYPFSFIGFAKSGHIVRYHEEENKDERGFLKSITLSDYMKCLAKVFESDIVLMKQKSKELGKEIYQTIYILNFENFDVTRMAHGPSIRAFIKLMSVYEANYPERMRRLIIINASPKYKALLNFTKHFLSEATLDKFTIFSTEGWKEELLKFIDADVLPAFLGGNRTDPDGNNLCNSFINHGRSVPQSLYLRSESRRLRSQPDVQKLMVSNKSSCNVTVDIPEAQTYIQWDFETEDGDIGFGLSCETNDKPNNKMEIFPTKRFDAHVGYESGMYCCEVPGRYILLFDNTYSWWKKKEVYYRVKVEAPSLEGI